MMTQEELVDVKGMRAAGMTYAEIAEATGRSPPPRRGGPYD